MMTRTASRHFFLSGSAMMLIMSVGAASAGTCVDDDPALLCIGRGYDPAGADTIDAIVVNADSDGDGPGLFAVVVGSDYEGYGSNLTGSDPGTTAQLRVETNAVVMNRNTTIAGASNLTIGGETTTEGLLDVNGGIEGENFSVANNSGNTVVGGTLTVNNTFRLDTNGATAGGTTIVGDNDVLTVTSGLTVLRGGTNSGVLTLDDGDAVNGTTLTISGSGGGTAATVLQTTTDASTTSVNTSLGSSSTAYTQQTVVQAGSNAVQVTSGQTGTNAAVTISGTVTAANTSNVGVLVTGSGQNGSIYDSTTAVAPPTWADVRVQSTSYGNGDPTRGTAIILTDYGIQMVSAAPAVNETMYNIQGGNSGEGRVDNAYGMNTGDGTVVNTFGSAAPTSGPVSSVENEIGSNYGQGRVSTLIGGGTAPTTTTVGNDNASTQTTMLAGSSSLALRDSSAVITGGTNGNNMTITNRGASFASRTGAPISVTGILDGTGEFDAVNVGQFASAIAATAAMAAIPQIRMGHSASFGVGVGSHMGYDAIAVGGRAYISDHAMFQFSAATGSRGFDPVYSAGVGLSW